VPVARPLHTARSFLLKLGCFATDQELSWQLTRDRDPRPIGTGKVVMRTFVLPVDMRLRKRWCDEMWAADRASAQEQGMCVP
jgi:hypothetical protein